MSTTALSPERETLLKGIAKHAVEGLYTFKNRVELKLIVSHKLGHDLPDAEITIVERMIKDVRAGK